MSEFIKPPVLTLQELHEALPIISQEVTSAAALLKDEERMRQSLDELTEYMNNGPLDVLVATHPRYASSTFSQYSFKLEHDIAHGGYQRLPNILGRFWPDSEYILALTRQNQKAKKPTVMAIAGISGKDTLLAHSNISKKDMPADIPDVLYITQLQGVRFEGKNSQRIAQNVTGGIQWERILETTCGVLCAQEGIPVISMLSGQKNAWYPTEANPSSVRAARRQRLIQRYDFTAKRQDYILNKDFAHNKVLFE